MAGTFKARDIKESELHSAQLRQIEQNAERTDESIQSIEWGLATNPEQFDKVPGRRLWAAKTDPFPNAPRLRVWFKFDDDTVELLSVERIADDD